MKPKLNVNDFRFRQLGASTTVVMYHPKDRASMVGVFKTTELRKIMRTDKPTAGDILRLYSEIKKQMKP